MGEQLSRLIIGVSGLIITLLLVGMLWFMFKSGKETYTSVGEQTQQIDPTLRDRPENLKYGEYEFDYLNPDEKKENEEKKED